MLAIQNQYERISNIRSDYLEKLSTAIVKQYDIICVEDLNVSGMMKNKRLLKAIQDSGWSMLLNKLEYKCRWRGKTFVKIGRYKPTSTMCSNCHAMHKDIVNSLSVRFWTCPDCGAEHDRDTNVAKNILIIGIGQILGMVEDHDLESIAKVDLESNFQVEKVNGSIKSSSKKGVSLVDPKLLECSQNMLRL